MSDFEHNDSKRKIDDFNRNEIEKFEKLKDDFVVVEKFKKIKNKKFSNEVIIRWIWNGEFHDYVEALIKNKQYVEYESLSKFWESYNHLKTVLKTKFGLPQYEGIGPRWQEKEDEPINLKHNFNNAVDIAWWKVEKYIYYVMVTGHDADSLLNLEIALKKG